MPQVEFGQRQVANSVRERLDGFLADDDSRRSKTVELKDAVPDDLVQRVQEEAADSRQAEADKAGQVSLSDRERKQIDFSREGVNVPFARSVKGIADNEGVTDWLQYADLELSVDENRRVLKDASNEERGRSGLGKSSEKRNIAKAADNKQKRRQQAEGAKQPAFEGDTNAADFLRDEQRFEDNLFDITLRSDAGPTGRDYERLEEAHENRSDRAKRIDERRSAEVTRDPLKWAQNKSEYDYPGIDTVEPAELHAERSRKARRVDEEEQAPIADSRQQWALNPDQYDWPGVDTKQRPSMADIKDTAQETMMAKNDVLVQSRARGGNEAMQESTLFGRAQSEDVSLDPAEATGDRMAGSMETTRTDPDAGMNAGLADIPEAMDAFAAAEEDRGDSGDGGVVGEFVDSAPDSLGSGFELSTVESDGDVEAVRYRRERSAAPFDSIVEVQNIDGTFSINTGVDDGSGVDVGPDFTTANPDDEGMVFAQAEQAANSIVSDPEPDGGSVNIPNTGTLASEQQRSEPAETGGRVLVDDSDQQASLDIGIDAGATRDREGKVAGSANFADERDELQPDNDAGEQAGLLEQTTNVGGDGQADLFGGDATETTGQEYLK